ncbi:Winged helix DNA-binding domain-containing protein [Aquipseudomonas alcaligenes]|uniref:Winged helix DNA-binding domain-containing protein n=1 Tax=Aquipseudomonas alcaligenes TaxID=43263 RepID=A0A1N6W6D6_AQUAC|nr:Winged helix DNA-binding domain-containing protein [Pseudomonas alcaligenes]
MAGRRGFERLYDMPERVIPAALLDHPQLSEAQRQLLLRASDALVVATERELRNYFRLDAVDSSKLHLADLVEAGELLPVRVES